MLVRVLSALAGMVMSWGDIQKVGVEMQVYTPSATALLRGWVLWLCVYGKRMVMRMGIGNRDSGIEGVVITGVSRGINLDSVV